MVAAAAAASVVSGDTGGNEDLAGIVPAEEGDTVPEETSVWDVGIRDHDPV